jgi:hypothetical protein
MKYVKKLKTAKKIKHIYLSQIHIKTERTHSKSIIRATSYEQKRKPVIKFGVSFSAVSLDSETTVPPI